MTNKGNAFCLETDSKKRKDCFVPRNDEEGRLLSATIAEQAVLRNDEKKIALYLAMTRKGFT